ncbi:chromatin remodeling protein EBS-like [Iris pallida]|uniref:Chromatin remodeling protein EBS-like n=1 Tax=Iris pallida TaxID=29817 RepID=A0AAX6EJU1_IRIPA|nr:chromatin remodeling protein EBS-like [Iris pallida]
MAKTKQGGGKKDVDSYTIKGTNKIVRAGECVLMRPSDSNNPPTWPASSGSIESDHRSSVVVRVRWYYRPEDSLGGRRQFHGAKELFLSTTTTCRARTPSRGSASSTPSRATPSWGASGGDYFCRFDYKAATGGFTPTASPCTASVRCRTTPTT